MKKKQHAAADVHFLARPRTGRKLLIILVLVVVGAVVYVSYSRTTKSIIRTPTFKIDAAVEHGGCKQATNYPYKAWIQGVVTEVQPAVEKDCAKLLAGDKLEQNRVEKSVAKWKSSMDLPVLQNHTADCNWLVDYLTGNLYNSELEANFPIAFSFIVYDSPEQFLRLFKVLYRLQNAYCIHPDQTSQYRQFFSNFGKCLPNVMIPKNLINVAWGKKTLLMAQMSCLNDLVDYRDRQSEKEKWRYVINLCGKELPLISTRMMVEKLISMNGTSSVIARAIPKTETGTIGRLLGHKLPHHLSLYKSMTYTALSAKFVYFLLQSSIAKDVYKVFMNALFPEEHFYATLFRAPGAPGGYNPHIPNSQYFKVDHYFWRTTQEELKLPCHGKTVHAICVVNYADLPRVMKETKNGSAAFFHNKYFMELDHVAMDCMEERIVGINKKEYELECGNRLAQSNIAVGASA